jgi:tRNA(fMet)-specific endonuclease VapC
MLDTDILSELIRRPASLQAKVTAIGESRLCTSVINACELRFGARKKASEALSNRVEQLLDTIEVLPLDRNVDRIYAEIRHALEAKGRPIGANDYLIAAHAVEQDCILVTRNSREFKRVPRLMMENWLSRPRRT